MQRIAVIGAGVAGLAAARSLALAGERPLLIAPPHDVASRGETLSPQALPLLEQLQLGEVVDANNALAGEGRFSVWGDGVLRRADDSAGRGLHLDRARFEQRMRELCDGMAERLDAAVSAMAHRPSGVVLTLADGRIIFAEVAIDCTGRAALSSGAASERRRLDRMVAAWRLLDLPDDAETAAATLIEAVELGWWYMAPLPGRRMMLGLFSDSDLLPRGLIQNGPLWARLAANTKAIAQRLMSLGLDQHLADAPPAMAPAATITVQHIVEGRILRAGDAAAALDPLGANGLATALWSGLAAAEAALGLVESNSAAAEAYERDYLAGIAHHLSTQRAMYQSEFRFADAPFWRRRNSSSPPR
ncbi:NAD(P)/FAD-dependent oxidoreductase [Rhodopseudomonas sp. B29]|uniref:NAD(P)/FAD-dependent oxidoreductase n=1 Tax=Rhodopseudomonas sp. B29 TaxID=95607 RepID=UPI00034A4E17|nr:tryptophan 7-halogenase [Rhodopseudomonas sp. B29]